MATPFVTRAARWACAAMLASSCSLILNESDGRDEPMDAGVDRDLDAAVARCAPAPVVFCEPADCPVCVPNAAADNCPPVLIRSSVGPGATDFALPSQWRDKRIGHLRRRHVLEVDAIDIAAGIFTVSGPVSGCAGVYIAKNNFAVLTGPGLIMTVDMNNGSPPCALGEALTVGGAVGAATVTRFIGGGVVEKAELEPGTYSETVPMVGQTPIADVNHYMWLAGSPENDGVGGGAIIAPPGGDGIIFSHEFGRIEGITVVGWGAGVSGGAAIRASAGQLDVSRVIVRNSDADSSMPAFGIVATNGADVQVYSSIARNIGSAAFRADNNSSVRVSNSIAFQCALRDLTALGCFEAAAGGSLVVRNSIAMDGNPLTTDFQGADQGMSIGNMSSDKSAPGASPITDADATSEFQSPETGNLSPAPGAQALATGENLCVADPRAARKIDGGRRPQIGPWNRGAF